MNEILKLERVSYTYMSKNNPVLAVRDVCASFELGKFYSITGRSGSGKTTLLSLIAGLDKTSSGDIIFNEKSLKKIDRDNYRSNNIGIVFQSFNLLPQLTALENVSLAIDISKCSSKNKQKRALDLLNKVGIDEIKAKRRVLKLSGGEQQRVAIARALSTNPKLILADEPTGNLDSDTSNTIINLLMDIAHKENKCVIMITHSKSIAKKTDEIYGMKDGVLLPIKIN